MPTWGYFYFRKTKLTRREKKFRKEMMRKFPYSYGKR